MNASTHPGGASCRLGLVGLHSGAARHGLYGRTIAQQSSKVFQEHPEWFVKDESGKLLRSDRVTLGGWRFEPWYALDGTHPAAQKHLENIFPTHAPEVGRDVLQVRRQLLGRDTRRPLSRFESDSDRSIQARHGGNPQRCRRCVLAGLQSPDLASLRIDSRSRSSEDIKWTWLILDRTMRQNLSRNWQNGTLWLNDPDAVTLSGDLPMNEYLFHATSILASGGMVISGDDLTGIPSNRLVILRRLVPASGIAAEFDGVSFDMGVIRRKDATIHCLFNWSGTPVTRRLEITRGGKVKDFRTGESLERRD